MAEFEPKQAIYTPSQVSTYGIESIHKIRESQTRTMNIGIPGLRDYFAPLLPGQLSIVIAQTSQYKSGFLHCVEHHVANQLMREGREEVIVHVSVEEGVEEQAYLEFARESGEDLTKLARGEVQDWNRLMEAAIRVGTVPIYRIGESLARAEELPNLYLTNILQSIKYLRSQLFERELEIAGIFVDYLQALPIDPEIRKTVGTEQRRLQVKSDIFRLRGAAKFFNCPVVVAVQAKQTLAGAPGPNMLIPGLYDGEESSTIAQRADRAITMWMPKMTHPIGTVLEHKGFQFRVDENLLFIRVAKQRGGLPSGATFRCRVDFNRNLIVPEGRAFQND